VIDVSTSVAAAKRARALFDDTNDMQTKITCKNGELVVQRTQDTTPYLDANKREIADAPSWRPYTSGRRRSPLRKLAEIPNIVVEQWLREGVNVFDPDPAMQRRVRWKLDSNEYRYLRTFPGRMGMRRQWV
jgi:hypothetical protein